jgi:hypothetical protein
MDMWTLLWITVIGGPLNGSQSYLLHPSYEECMAAHQIVSDTFVPVDAARVDIHG